MVVREVILASGSKWRRELLASTGLVVEAVDPGVDEAQITADDPVELARARARAKALRSRASIHEVSWWGPIKSCISMESRTESPQIRRRMPMLRTLRGRVHAVDGGLPCGRGGIRVFRRAVPGWVRPDVSDDEIDAYVASGEARGCAGGYMVERRGAWLVEHVDGDWNNVIGLPIAALVDRLRARGWRLPEAP